MSALPIVAIVGRPNVGKSTLFNRIVGQQTAIVEDTARTTRDRLYGEAEWNGRRFLIVDTGGLELDARDQIEARVQEQARLAIAEADVIVFVVDAPAGLTIVVRDTGIGIAKEDIPRVTEPFIQVDSSLSRRHEGTGLGLALVAALMELHGGTLNIDSELGKGTTVAVTFPMRRIGESLDQAARKAS